MIKRITSICVCKATEINILGSSHRYHGHHVKLFVLVAILYRDFESLEYYCSQGYLINLFSFYLLLWWSSQRRLKFIFVSHACVEQEYTHQKLGVHFYTIYGIWSSQKYHSCKQIVNYSVDKKWVGFITVFYMRITKVKWFTREVPHRCSWRNDHCQQQ